MMQLSYEIFVSARFRKPWNLVLPGGWICWLLIDSPRKKTASLKMER